jgi:hypothetical protein
MQGGYEDDLVIVLQDIIAFSFQLPIGVIYQDEDTRPSVVYVEYALKAHELAKYDARLTRSCFRRKVHLAL